MVSAISHSGVVLKTAPVHEGKFPFGSLAEFRREPLAFFEKVARMGDVVRLRFGFTIDYQVSHPDGAQHVLQTNNRNYVRDPYGNGLLKMVTGLNLFTSDGDTWLGQRRLMQPAFHRQRLASFGEIMTDATQQMLARWQPAIEQGKYLDLHTEMMRITMEVVGRALFSIDLSEETSVLGRAFTTSTAYVNFRFNTPFYLPLWVPTPRNRSLNQAIRDVQGILQAMIDERHRTGERKDDLMDMLMEARYEDTGEPMTDEQLRAELGIIIGAGQETTSNALTWTFYLLSEHPEVEARLVETLDATLGGRLPEVSDLPNLTYLEWVVKESMRLYPPAWAVSTRQAIEDDEILGYHIPKGRGVMILPWVLHRDPRFWEQPLAFDPLRFSPERSADRHKFAYIPFGGGPRKCIGNTFALIEAQLILATILPRYKVRVMPDYKVGPEPIFTLRVKGGLPVRVETR